MKNSGFDGTGTESSRIPSLDGLRAISIGMVLTAHVAGTVAALEQRPLLLYTIGNGNRGVSVFFVISGFLITSLLLKEKDRTGKISLSDFYLRRAFRILPPFWAFLVCVAVLWRLGLIQTSWPALGVALTFLRDYIPGDWWTGHSWSLSVEEQFYLLWPATLVFLGQRKSQWIAFCLIISAPVVRVLSHLLLTGRLGPIESFMFHMRVDSLMFGSALAMLYKTPAFIKLSGKILKWPGLFVALSFFLFVSGYLNYRFQAYYMYPFGYTLENIAISYMILYFVSKPTSLGGRLLNAKAVVHVGLISYSLYLWQQLFLTPLWGASIFAKFPINLACAFLLAELSWQIVELPALKARRAFVRASTPPPLPQHMAEIVDLPADRTQAVS